MSARLAWPLLALWALGAAVAGGLLVAAGQGLEVLAAFGTGAYAVVGALVLRRRPGNALGPVMLLLAWSFTASMAFEALYDREGVQPTDAVLTLLVVDEALFYLWFGLVSVALPLLFPDGRLEGRGRRRFAAFAAAALTAQALVSVFGVRRIDWQDPGETVVNPHALDGPVGDALRAAEPVTGLLVLPVLLGALGLTAVGWRGARGRARQQLKWFAVAMAVLLAGLMAAFVGEAWPPAEPVGNAGWGLFLLGVIVLLPAALGVAVLRHDLYDVDRVIRRALVYGGLTATLGAAYLGCVLLGGLAAGGSSASVAVATLAVAALFRPARGRIQAAVDRRFYRSRYDAQRTLEAFGAELRDEVDLDALAGRLRTTARDTVQPAHVSLWMRP